MGKHDPNLGRAMTAAERSAKRRAALRAKGLKLKQFWLPDTSDPKWRAEASAESARVAASETDDDREFFASLIDWDKLPPY
jgi:hypothetical protein